MSYATNSGPIINNFISNFHFGSNSMFHHICIGIAIDIFLINMSAKNITFIPITRSVLL